MAFQLTNTANVTDDATLELDGADSVATAIVGGTTYLFAGSLIDDGVSVFSVAADGSLTNVDNVTDAGALELDGVRAVTTAVVGGVTYLFVTGINDDGVSVFSVAANGTLTSVHDVTDGGTLALNGAFGATTAIVGGTTYLFVTSVVDNGVSVFSVAANGTLTNVDNVTDDATLELDQARGVTTAIVAGTTYLFVAGNADDGLSVFSVAANGTLTNVDNVADDATLQLDGANSVTTAVVGGATYLFVAAVNDNAVSVFSVAADGTLTSVDDVTGLGSPAGVTTAVIGGTTYLFVASVSLDVVRVFSVAADGTLTSVADVFDGGARELDGTEAVTTAVVAGVTHLFAPGQFDDGVSAFSLDGDVPLLGDVLWQHSDGTVAIAGHELPAVSANFPIRGTGDFDRDGDSDILWHHVQGLVVTWEMENGELLATHSLASASSSYQIADTGDFDNDGDADILWRHAQGAVVIWEMEDGALVTNHNLPAVSTSFQVAGTGDFDSDGDADILWRHTSGLVVIWEIEDSAFVTNHNLPVVSNAFQVAGVGDFDRDGDADILWRHSGGLNVIWEMEDGAFVTNHNLPQVSTSYQVAGVEDFDSDGDADILWRHEQGQIVTWTMENHALVQTQNFGVVSNGWQIRGTGEFDLI